MPKRMSTKAASRCCADGARSSSLTCIATLPGCESTPAVSAGGHTRKKGLVKHVVCHSAPVHSDRDGLAREIVQVTAGSRGRHRSCCDNLPHGDGPCAQEHLGKSTAAQCRQGTGHPLGSAPRRTRGRLFFGRVSAVPGRGS